MKIEDLVICPVCGTYFIEIPPDFYPISEVLQCGGNRDFAAHNYRMYRRQSIFDWLCDQVMTRLMEDQLMSLESLVFMGGLQDWPAIDIPESNYPMSRYENMSTGYTIPEVGTKLNIAMPSDIRKALEAAGIRPTGGTMENPRFNRLHVDQLAQIRASQKKRAY